MRHGEGDAKMQFTEFAQSDHETQRDIWFAFVNDLDTGFDFSGTGNENRRRAFHSSSAAVAGGADADRTAAAARARARRRAQTRKHRSVVSAGSTQSPR